MVLYTSEQRVFLDDTYVKYRSARECWRKLRCKFCDVPSRQTIHNLVNKLRSAGLLIDTKWKCKLQVLTEDKLDDTGATLEHTPRKSVKCLAQRLECQSLVQEGQHNCWSLAHALQPWNPASRVPICNWFPQFVIEGEIDLQLAFFTDEAWFHLQGYVHIQNNHYWSSENPHLTHEVLLHPVKVGICCAARSRRIVGPVFFNKTINYKKYVDRSREILSRVTRRRNTVWLVSAGLSYYPHCMYIYAGFVWSLQEQNYQQWYLASMFTQS
jgi:hypothetical protein